LIEAGADEEVQNNQGKTALDVARTTTRNNAAAVVHCLEQTPEQSGGRKRSEKRSIIKNACKRNRRNWTKCAKTTAEPGLGETASIPAKSTFLAKALLATTCRRVGHALPNKPAHSSVIYEKLPPHH